MVESNSIPTALACVVLAAGQGTRMRSSLPKVLHPVAGMAMVGHVLSACAELLPERMIVVIAPNSEVIEKEVLPNRCVVQPVALGTGDAVKAARTELEDFDGDILIVFGDTPLITAGTLNALRLAKSDKKAVVAVAGFRPANPAAYGRLVLNDKQQLTAIVEVVEASPEQRAINLCNGGIMLVAGKALWALLDGVNNNNAKGEYYLTDIVGLAVKAGMICAVAEMPEDEVLGINTRVELARAEAIMQQRLREQAMLAGVTMTDPSSVFLSHDTKFGRDVVIAPHVVFGTGVEVADRVTIRSFCHFEQTRIDEGAILGPYARVRPGSVVGAGAHIGNFVELKNAEIGRGAKINHLSYIGDAFVGEKANIGAGTITCNYDGFRKSHTHIGAETFIGSNTSLVAPVKVGDGSYVGAGSVITAEVPPHTLAVARGRQANIEGWARRFRDEQNIKKK